MVICVTRAVTSKQPNPESPPQVFPRAFSCSFLFLAHTNTQLSSADGFLRVLIAVIGAHPVTRTWLTCCWRQLLGTVKCR